MGNENKFYINGQWTKPFTTLSTEVTNPSNGSSLSTIAMGTEADLNKAVIAARTALQGFGHSSAKERQELLRSIISVYEKRSDDLAQAVSCEMGAPYDFAKNVQVWIGRAHLERMVDVLDSFEFEYEKGGGLVVKEPVGVVGLKTPWNWPLNQIACKVAPAIAAGCSMILKPSEIAPLDAVVFAEIMHEAGVPAGVFNMINGSGAQLGNAMSAHPDIDMMSFTGSTRAGVIVAKAAADTVKRVHQELGGKSANILFPDVDLQDAVEKGIAGCYLNCGQSCNAPTRMFVFREQHDQALTFAKNAAESYTVGPASSEGVDLGPVVSQLQFDKIQALIQSGIDEGATLVAGGTGKPEGLDSGFYVKPTIFGNVTPKMRIAVEEIFGPVLVIIPYDTIDHAISMAEDTVYGLAAYIQCKDTEVAKETARKLRVGNVHINYPQWQSDMPFGGYKRSGNGREYAEYGLEDFLETKGIIGR